MKCVAIITGLFFCLMANAQDEITSFYLKAPVELSKGFVGEIPDKLKGTYTLSTDSSSNLVFDSSGISIESKHLTVVTLDQIQKNSAWYLSDGKIHGIDKNEALHYIERNDSFFVALNLDYSIVDLKSTTKKLGSSKDHWAVFEKSDGFWLLTYRIIWDKKGLYFSAFDHEKVIDQIKSWKSVNETTMNGYKTYIADPTNQELQDLLKNEAAFIDSRFFIELKQ